MLKVNIKKHYHGFQLKVDFEVGEEVVVLVGPSGAGKSTILNCIAGIINPDSGRISLRNQVFFDSANNVKLAVQNRRVGYLYQAYALFPHMSIIKNIQYGMPYAAKKDELYLKEFMDKFKVHHLADKYPHQLSGGEKQRAALARALAMKPEVLLLDEAFSALDVDTRHKLYKEFIHIKQEWKIPIILITHNEEEAGLLGDRLLKINMGRLVT